jgi:hypothetical protein
MEVPLQEDCLKPSFRIDIFISFQNILDSYLKRKQSENICNVRLVCINANFDGPMAGHGDDGFVSERVGFKRCFLR